MQCSLVVRERDFYQHFCAQTYPKGMGTDGTLWFYHVYPLKTFRLLVRSVSHKGGEILCTMGWNFFLLPYQKKLESQATVVPRVDNAIHRVNLYFGFPHTCLMDDDLPGAKCYPMFEQKQGQIICRCQSKGSSKSYLFLKSLKSGSASFCIANFFLLSKKIETLSIILKKYSVS